MLEVLDRDKVVQVLKDIFNACNLIEGKSVKFMPPNADSVFSKGYQIHIEPSDDESFTTCIERIAIKYDLATAKERNALIIFNPVKE